MTPERWAEVGRLCDAALDLDPASREAFLRQACEDDELRREVAALLAQESRAAGFLEAPAIESEVGPAASRPRRFLARGTRLGPYEIEAFVGAGGMGEVYRARDLRLKRTVAIKLLRDHSSFDSDRRRRFEHEAHAAAALNHPHVCALYDTGEAVPSTPQPGASGPDAESVRFLVMEFLEGETLAARLARGALPIRDVLEYGAQIADALSAAHRHGVVHRDLKPGNVMLTEGGAKLLDFGVAKLWGRGDQPAAEETGPLTAQGAIVGTPQYMAPEQLEGKPPDTRVDIFAFGAVVYEMITGCRALEGEAAAVLERDPAHVEERQLLTPPALDRLVRKCLAKDPDARWQSAADVAEALRGISADLASAQPARAPRPPLRRRRAFATIAALLMLAAAAVTWIAVDGLSWRSPEPVRFSLAMPANTALDVSVWSTLAVAADGSGIAYMGRSGNRSQLYWHDLHGSVGWALPGTEGATTPFLSPDNRWLGFFREGKLLALPLQSGRVVRGSSIKELAATDAVRGATWSENGTIVYGVLAGGLWRVAAAGGPPEPLTKLDSSTESDHRWPSFLPGGHEVLFTVQHASVRQDRGALVVLSLKTGRRTKILDGGVYGRYIPGGHLVFGRNGTLLAAPFDSKILKVTGDPAPVLNDVAHRFAANLFAFDVAADGTVVYASSGPDRPGNAMVWVSRDGGVKHAVADRLPYEFVNFAISPDGQRLATTIDGDAYANIWIWDLRDQRWQQLRVDADCYTPVWSPAGDRLAFSSNRDGALNLYVMAADGESPPERLSASRGLQRPRSWSPDGRFLAFEVQTPGTLYETRILQLNGYANPWPWGPPGVAVTGPAFSPDGHWLAYQSRESGRWEVWVRPFSGPGPRQLVSGSEGGLAPAWEGSEIYYLERLGDTRIMSRRVESTSPLRLSASTRVAFALPFPLAVRGALLSQGYAVEPGGRRVLVVRSDERASHEINALNVITNWPEDVKARLRGRR